MAMKFSGLLLLAVLIISAGLPYMYAYYIIWDAAKDEFFFGVTYGQDTVEEAKLLIDKVKDYTNLFVLDSYSISNSTNGQELNEICDYAAAADLHFIVYFFSFYDSAWKQEWVTTAEQKWGDKFLGVYLRDEPGGRQIDLPETVPNASSYSEAASKFVQSIQGSFSMNFLNSKGIPVFTSDYALYWFDYLSGYDTVFVELGWNHSKTQNIALGRGAANVQRKEWGAIIVWTYDKPPYLESGPKILQDMLTAYRAGAKYVIIFNYAEDFETGKPYCILKEEHFTAMKQFWTYIYAHPRNIFGKVDAQVAFVLPKDYGWGMRRLKDSIWGLWSADKKAPLIWENMNKLIQKYGLELDIVYDDARFNFQNNYSTVYFWNSTIN